MDFVLDSSVAIAWCFEDEASAATDAILDRLADETAVVPSLWHLEVANVLALGERKRRLTPARATEFVSLLQGLPIGVDAETPARALGAILDLARSGRLTAYDAAYLELCMRLGLPLASQDQALRQAARRLGVSLLAP
ncbi:MAG: type II toxin-antitoxin system VapC family toxin [Myxococcales bacterium]